MSSVLAGYTQFGISELHENPTCFATDPTRGVYSTPDPLPGGLGLTLP